jgi:foldase protein PrsA
MKKLFSLGVLAATMAVGSACSQEEIVATYKDGKATKKEVIEDFANQYNQDIETARTRYNNLGVEEKKAVIKNYLDSKLLLAEAEREKLHKSAEFERQMETARKQLLSKMLIDQKISSKISEAQIDEKYQEVKEQKEGQQEYKFRIITNPEQKKVKEAHEKLNNGRKFEDIATEYDYDGGQNGGMFANGYYIEESRLGETLFNTLNSMQPGKYSKPFKLEGRWAIVSLVNKRDFQLPPKESIYDQIRQNIIMDKYRSYVDNLRNEYNLDIKLEDSNSSDNKSSGSHEKATHEAESKESAHENKHDKEGSTKNNPSESK